MTAQGLTAITHLPSPNLQGGERTYVGHSAIDMALARRQHEQYQDALRRIGASVVTLDGNLALPDCVFVEDTAIVLDEVAVMMSMGATSRRGEPAARSGTSELPDHRARRAAGDDRWRRRRAGRARAVRRRVATNERRGHCRAA